MIHKSVFCPMSHQAASSGLRQKKDQHWTTSFGNIWSLSPPLAYVGVHQGSRFHAAAETRPNDDARNLVAWNPWILQRATTHLRYLTAMELYAAGLNAWSQLEVDTGEPCAGTTLEPCDISSFTRILSAEAIERPVADLSSTLSM